MSRRSKAEPGKTKPNKSEPGDTESKAPAAAVGDQPSDVEALRYELVRRLMLIVSDWNRCPKRACKRHRGCAATGLDCMSLPPEPPGSEMTPDQKAAVVADFRRALERRRAELAGGR
jgi:hypothetical protein